MSEVKPGFIITLKTPRLQVSFLNIVLQAGVCGSCGVFRAMNRVASAPSCSAFIHRVTLEEVSGHQVLIKSKTEKSGSFGTWHQHEATSRISS